MKVLVAHNRYRSDAPSGENAIVDAEIELLRSYGIDVIGMIEDSDSIEKSLQGSLRAAPGPIYSTSGVNTFKHLLDAHRPDVVHLHNVFPLISPWVVRVAAARGIPVIHTVHNYRHSCVAGTHFRDGAACTDCIGTRFRVPALLHGCYRGSHLQTLPMTLSQNLHARTWREGIGTFIALTPFMKEKLEGAGVPASKIVVRPTWVPDPGPPQSHNTDFIYVGRLEEAKGLHLLLEAWSHLSSPHQGILHIVGDGPLAATTRELSRKKPSIIMHGRLEPTDVANLMSRCGVTVLPSLTFEGYPLVMAESFSHGRGVVALAGGANETIIERTGAGWIAQPTASDLADTLGSLTLDDIRAVGAIARISYEKNNSPSAAASSLLQIYENLVVQS